MAEKPHKKMKMNQAENGKFVGAQPNAITPATAGRMSRLAVNKRRENKYLAAMAAMNAGVPETERLKFIEDNPDVPLAYAGMAIMLTTRMKVANDPDSGTAGVMSAKLLIKASGHAEDRRTTEKSGGSGEDVSVSALVNAIEQLVSMKDKVIHPVLCGNCGNSVVDCTCPEIT